LEEEQGEVAERRRLGVVVGEMEDEKRWGREITKLIN
jgi:hypothetical protein